MDAVRAPDFAETGSYHVRTGSGTKTIYRDPESRNWYEDADGHWTEHFLGFDKNDALKRLELLYGPPYGPHREKRQRR